MEQKNEIALRTSEGFVSVAQNFLKTNGDIVVPPNYDVNDAVKSLYLKTLETKDKQGKPALEVCSKESIQQVIQTYVSNGLNVSKNQCYLIVYGDKLALQTSYFGKQKQATEYAGIRINSDVVYAGEQLKIEKRVDGSKVIHHQPDFSKFDTTKIIGAYAVAIDKATGNVVDSDIMTKRELDVSAAKSKTGGTVYKEFPVEMSKKIVIARLAKRFINTSNDGYKYGSIESDMGEVEGIRQEINADSVINDDTITVEPVPEQQPEMEQQEFNYEGVDDLFPDTQPETENEEKEVYYSEYKNHPEKYNLVEGSYNRTTKTCRVTLK